MERSRPPDARPPSAAGLAASTAVMATPARLRMRGRAFGEAALGSFSLLITGRTGAPRAWRNPSSVRAMKGEALALRGFRGGRRLGQRFFLLHEDLHLADNVVVHLHLDRIHSETLDRLGEGDSVSVDLVSVLGKLVGDLRVGD